VKDKAVEKAPIPFTILWSLQSTRKNGITDTLKHVEPILYGIVFLHIKHFSIIRRFNKCNSNPYPGDTCLSTLVYNTGSGMIDFVTTS
jgi:hypothetical protein